MYLSLRSTTTDLFLEGFDLEYKVLVEQYKVLVGLKLALGVPVLQDDNPREDNERNNTKTLELRNALHAGAGSGGGISEEVHGWKRIGQSRVSGVDWSVVGFVSRSVVRACD